jgi:selenophosphate synthetase-related protein
MGTYLISVQKKEIKKIVEIAARHHCPVVEVGTVTKDAEITIGDEVAVDSEKMQEMIRKFPYRKAHVRGTKNEKK